jgi:hypothetical protein
MRYGSDVKSQISIVESGTIDAPTPLVVNSASTNRIDKKLNLSSYPERWRDRPCEASATARCASTVPIPAEKSVEPWKMRGDAKLVCAAPLLTMREALSVSTVIGGTTSKWLNVISS